MYTNELMYKKKIKYTEKNVYYAEDFNLLQLKNKNNFR